MNEHAINSAVSVLLGITGLAVVAVLVSNKAQTGSVLGAGGSALGNLICIAVSPITGDSCGARSLGVNIRPPVTGTRPVPPREEAPSRFCTTDEDGNEVCTPLER